tara:strand:- start:13194 stop:13604 length:411 start_codon:yes stop_codon:yes gene_type:complete
MDLSKLSVESAADKGAFLHLKDPATGDPLFDPVSGESVGIFLRGNDSAQVKEASRKLDLKELRGDTDTQKELLAELLAVATISWTGIGFGSEEEEFPCTPENAKKLYSDSDTDWIVEQVVPFMRLRRNFVGNRPSD